MIRVGWVYIEPKEVAAWFANKRGGWKPSQTGCAAISGGLDWMFQSNAPASQHLTREHSLPTIRLTAAAHHASALRSELPGIIADLEVRAVFRETYVHKERGADVDRDTIWCMNELYRLLGIVENLTKPLPKPSLEWRIAARKIFMLISNQATFEGRKAPLSINGQSHIATVVAAALERVGQGTHTAAAIADACNDPRLRRVVHFRNFSNGTVARTG